ncbi:MAG: glutathione S-transferase family protein, partial [Polyangiaceae bacterium]
MPTLVTIPFSHFCEKARWALDHTRVAYREEGHSPLFHRRAVARASGKAGSVPVLVLDGDGVLDDSPLIVRWADARATSDRKLLPSGGRELDEALALERHLDHHFAPHVRRLGYFHLLPDRARALHLMGLSTPRLEHAVVKATFPVLRGLLRRVMQLDAEHAMLSRDKVRTLCDEVEHRLADGRPYLVGDRFGVADLAFAAFASPLLAPAEHPVRRQSTLELPGALLKDSTELR